MPLFCLMIALSLNLPAASSSLSLTAPLSMDVSGQEAFEIQFESTDDVGGLSASLLLPDGLHYAGNTRMEMSGGLREVEPSLAGGWLRWDLADALRSFRHIVINEFEANPAGSDTKMEWVEIYNPTAEGVDIGNWLLVDSYYNKTVLIPAHNIIMPGAYQTINWTNGSLVNSYPASLFLLDLAGREVDRTLEAKDDKNNDLCWARLSDGRDLDNDSDWKFQKATPGLSNGGQPCEIYAGESLGLYFNLSAGCSAPDHARLYAEMDTASGKLASPPRDMGIGRANLSLFAQPDRFDIAKGDTVIWTVILENNGNGTAHNVALNATLSSGLVFAGTNSVISRQTISPLAPGKREEIKLRAKAVATKTSYCCDFSLAWGPGPCQEIRQNSQLSPRTAIAKEPDQPRSFTIGQSVPFTIFADLPRGARDLWINDTIPGGLIYNHSSLSWQGRDPMQETRIENSDGSQQISWFFGDIGSAQQIGLRYDCLLPNIASNQNGSPLAGTNATMTWLEGGASQRDADCAGPISIAEPDLHLDIWPAHTFAAPGNRIHFLLNVSHTTFSEASAFDLEMQVVLPAGLVFEMGSAEAIAGPTTSFDEQNLLWKIDSLDWMAGESAVVSFNAICQGQPGDRLVLPARITWTSQPGVCPEERTGAGDALNNYFRIDESVIDVMDLSINKSADLNPAPVGEILTYTLTYENLGNLGANNVNITDKLDAGVTFISADPAPSWNTSQTLFWTVQNLQPGNAQSIALQVRVNETLPDSSLLENCFSICSDELETRSPICIHTPVLNETRLEVVKKPLQKAVRRGEEVDYIITVCNRGGQPATNITVRDVFDTPVELLSVWPEMAEDGAWHFSYLAPGECLEIALKVRVPRIDVTYHSSQTVSGRGFMRSFRDYSTSRPAAALVNRVHVTSDQMQLSASASVEILAEAGTELSLREHGRGQYQCQEKLEFLTANKSIRLERSIKAESHPQNGSLPGMDNRISSSWHEDVRAKNGITNTTFRESYRYSSRLGMESRFSLDENQSLMNVNSSLEGLAHLGMLKLSTSGCKRGNASISQENYAGSFRIQECISDLGQGVMVERSSSGTGYVAKDAVIGQQRSYEWGSGKYRSEEKVDSISGSSAKEMEASFHNFSLPVSERTYLNISQKWSEGLISRTQSSLISEDYYQASRLKMKAVSSSPRERVSESSFSGGSRMQAAYLGRSGGNRSLELAAEEMLIGNYTVKRKIILSGAARYDHPHLSLRKEGRKVEDVAAYTITICNDGNAALAPIFLQDFFPPGASFINSTLSPTRMDGNSSNWTILHLAIGDCLSLGINLDVESCPSDIINRAVAEGSYSSGSVAAQNISVLEANPLGYWPGPGIGSIVCQANNISSPCSALKSCNQSDFLDPIEIALQMDDKEGKDGYCALSARALEEDITSRRC